MRRVTWVSDWMDWKRGNHPTDDIGLGWGVRLQSLVEATKEPQRLSHKNIDRHKVVIPDPSTLSVFDVEDTFVCCVVRQRRSTNHERQSQSLPLQLS